MLITYFKMEGTLQRIHLFKVGENFQRREILNDTLKPFSPHQFIYTWVYTNGTSLKDEVKAIFFNKGKDYAGFGNSYIEVWSIASALVRSVSVQC